MARFGPEAPPPKPPDGRRQPIQSRSARPPSCRQTPRPTGRPESAAALATEPPGCAHGRPRCIRGPAHTRRPVVRILRRLGAGDRTCPRPWARAAAARARPAVRRRPDPGPRPRAQGRRDGRPRSVYAPRPHPTRQALRNLRSARQGASRWVTRRVGRVGAHRRRWGRPRRVCRVARAGHRGPAGGLAAPGASQPSVGGAAPGAGPVPASRGPKGSAPVRTRARNACPAPCPCGTAGSMTPGRLTDDRTVRPVRRARTPGHERERERSRDAPRTTSPHETGRVPGVAVRARRCRVVPDAPYAREPRPAAVRRYVRPRCSHRTPTR